MNLTLTEDRMNINIACATHLDYNICFSIYVCGEVGYLRAESRGHLYIHLIEGD